MARMYSNKTTFYLAGPLKNRELIKFISDSLCATNRFENTAPWFNMDPVDQADDKSLASRADYDMNGVRNAQFGIVMLPAGYGTHTELGAMLALGKPTFLFVPSDPSTPWSDAVYKCVFHYHPEITAIHTSALALMADLVSRYCP